MANNFNNSSYIYVRESIPYFDQQIALLVSQLQGPIVESDNFDDLAFKVSGEDFHYEQFKGKRNLNLSSIG